ncbi:hypothetical protein ACVME8_003451 [Bradyrhizobium diazoefficiens]
MWFVDEMRKSRRILSCHRPILDADSLSRSLIDAS